MKTKLYSIAILLAICGGTASAQTDERDRHVATATEIAAQTFTYIHGERTGFISASHSFEFVFGVAPATAAISITPCMQGGSCGTAVTSTSTANQVLTTSGIWDQYNIVVTTTGTPLSIVVNITGTHSSFLKLTTLGSGAATLVNNVLNIPVGGGGGTGCTPGVTTAVLKGDGAGGCGPATAGTDYVVPAGNVATATLLQNARLINGVSFNGGADITVTVPVSTGVTGLGTNVAAFLATASSANLAAAVTDETGTGTLVFSASPTFTGVPLVPTAAPGTNTLQAASTAFVTAAVAAGGGGTNPMTTLGDETYGGAAGALTRLAGPTTTAHVFTLADIPVAGAAVAETWYDLSANVPLLASANTFTATQMFNGQIIENQQDTTSTHGFTLNNSAASRLLTIGYDATPTLQINWGATRLATFTGLATITNAWAFSSMLAGTVATIASGTTITPVTPYVIISGTTTVTTITAPTGTAALVGASFDFETTSAVPFTTGGNIASPGFTTVALTPYRCVFMGTTNASWYCK